MINGNLSMVNIKTILKVLLTISLIIIIIYNVSFDKFAESFNEINIYPVVISILLSPLVALLGTIKWQQIINHEAEDAKFAESLISFLGGMSLGLLTPGRVGEFGRIAFIKSGRLGVLAGIALVDKVIDLEVTLAIGIISVYIFFGLKIAILLTIIVLAGVIFIYFPNVFISPFEKLIDKYRIRKLITNFLVGISTIPGRTIVICLFYRLLASIIDIIQFYLLINAFSLINFIDVVAVYPIIILTNILPLTIGGVGIREGVSIIVLSQYGIPPEVAVNASFLLFCINTLLPGMLGTLFITRANYKRVKA